VPEPNVTQPPPEDVPVPADEPAPEGASRASVAPRGAGWRDQVVGAELTLLAVGAWLIASPLVLGYDAADDAWVPLAGGALIGAVAVLRATGAWRARALSALCIAVGAALVVSAPFVAAPIAGQWNQGLMGGAAIVLALVGLAGTQRGRELHPDG
jgi:peptidoglycan/LPS O-acetylase OafA/YrhL